MNLVIVFIKLFYFYFISNAHRKGKHTKHNTRYMTCKPCCENKNEHKSHINCTYTDNRGRTITIGGKWGHRGHQMLGHNTVLLYKVMDKHQRKKEKKDDPVP